MKKLASSSKVTPKDSNVAAAAYSWPTNASGILMPCIAIQSMCFSQYAHGAKASE